MSTFGESLIFNELLKRIIEVHLGHECLIPYIVWEICFF